MKMGERKKCYRSKKGTFRGNQYAEPKTDPNKPETPDQFTGGTKEKVRLQQNWVQENVCDYKTRKNWKVIESWTWNYYQFSFSLFYALSVSVNHCVWRN